MTFTLEQGRVLAPLTTLGLGGPAKHYVEARTREELVDALAWATREGERVGILGGGSNLVVADAGFEGLVVRMATRGIELQPEHDHALLTVQAGELWQDVVNAALDSELAGLECLTGIPGSAGATPIQNVGAYGQEVSDSIVDVEVLERETLTTAVLGAHECEFAYRMSRFKREPERFVVLAVRFRLRRGAPPTLRYAELERAFGARTHTPTLRETADTVRALRAAKSMVLDASDVNGRSAGSFFTNPIVTEAEATRVKRTALARGFVAREQDVPCFDAGAGLRKLAAAWLIERAGIHKGMRRGNVGVSTRHTLALVHHGGGSTRELLELADEVRARVRDVFAIELEMEPVRWGFGP